MSFFDELAVALLRYFEARAMDYDVNRIPALSKETIWSRRIRDLRLKFETN